VSATQARKGGTPVIHQLAEHTAEQEQREEIYGEASRRLHKGHRPFGEERLSKSAAATIAAAGVGKSSVRP
jgi:hypothetical protein